MTITFVGGTGISTTGAARGTTSTTVAYNNVSAGRLALLTVGIKPNTGTITDPSGWTKVGEQAGGTGTNAADTGQTKVAVYYKVLTGSETGSVTINATGGSIQGVMDVFSKTLGSWDVGVFVAGSDSSHGTNFSAVCGTWASDGLNTTDHVFVAQCGDTDDSTTATSAPTLTQTSVTFGTVTGRSQIRNTSGNQGMTYTWSAAVNTGATNANAPTAGFTWSVSSCGPAMVLRLREYDSFNALTETFASALDSTKWAGSGGLTTTGGAESFDLTGYTELHSVRNYSMTDATLCYRIVTFPADNGAYYAGVRICQYSNSGSDFLGVYFGGNGSGGQISYERTGTTAQVAALDTTNHAWVRIRDDSSGSGNIFLETAPDGITWTTQRTLSGTDIPSWRGNTGLQVVFEGGNAGTFVFDDVNNAPVATNAPAGSASGAGSAGDASVAMSANADAAIGTGLANDATVVASAVTLANADVATGSGVANDGQVVTAGNADVAVASGAGQDAVATATINADVATSTATAAPASASATANAVEATGSGSALDATVTTTTAVQAAAGLAAGAGTASDTAPELGALASAATSSGTAQDALSALQALPPTPSAGGGAFDAAAAILAGAIEALGSGSALDATASTLAQTNASAEAPEAVGSALGASVISSASAEAPTASGSALDASVIIGANAAAATALGAALDVLLAAGALAGGASGTGQADDATVTTAATTNAPADVATSVGQAPDPSVATSIPADVAAALGVAMDAAGSVAALPGGAAGAGMALDATVSAIATVTALAESAEGAGTAWGASVSITVAASAALGSGTVDATVAALGVPADLATSLGQAGSALAALGAVALLAEGAGQALDLDTGGKTTAPTGWVVTETKETRALTTVTGGPLISQTPIDIVVV